MSQLWFELLKLHDMLNIVALEFTELYPSKWGDMSFVEKAFVNPEGLGLIDLWLV